MIFGNDRGELRAMYAQSWQKRIDGRPLSPLGAQIARVIEEHPEYRDAVTGPLDREYTVEDGQANPFLHMGLHLGLREQVSTDRPSGIAAVFRELGGLHGDPHEAEHRMIEILAETLWEAQRNNVPADEVRYLERLRRLLRKSAL